MIDGFVDAGLLTIDNNTDYRETVQVNEHRAQALLHMTFRSYDAWLTHERSMKPRRYCGMDESRTRDLAGPLVTAGVILPKSVDLRSMIQNKFKKHERLVRDIYDKRLSSCHYSG